MTNVVYAILAKPTLFSQQRDNARPCDWSEDDHSAT